MNLLRHQIFFVGGKGGVGKTTTAAALALCAADRRRRCLVVSTDPAHSLGDIFGRTIGDSETALAPNLTGLEIDPDAAAAAHLETVKHQMTRLVHPRMYDAVNQQLELARYAPGATEAALLERVAELMTAAGTRFDLVIFDTAPSGHTVRLLSLPEVMGAWVDGLLRHRSRASTLTSMFKRLGGGRQRGDDLSLLEEAEDHPAESVESRVNAVLQERRRKFIAARERLLDTTRTAFLLVINPDRLSILESQKTVATLQRFDMTVSSVVVNRVFPDVATASGDFIEARRKQERMYLREIDTVFATLPRRIIPLRAHDVHGLASLREVGEYLLAP